MDGLYPSIKTRAEQEVIFHLALLGCQTIIGKTSELAL